MKSIKDFFLFLKADADWSQFGILISDEDVSPILCKWIIEPYPSYDTLKYDQIVKIFGTKCWIMKMDWLGIISLFRKMFKLYKICVKVNKMKIFL